MRSKFLEMRQRGQRPYGFPIMFRGANIRSGPQFRSRVAYNAWRTAGRARGRRRLRNAAALNQRTGGLLGIEKKFVDCAVSAAFTAPTGSTGGEMPPGTVITGCYTAPAQGDGPTNRDGNKIMVCELNLHGVIQVASQADQTAADTSCEILLAFVQDTQTNGAQLNSEDVFTNPGGNALTAASPFRNMSYTSRFKILKMKQFNLRIPTLTFDGTNIEQTGFHSKINLKWKGKVPVTFTTASTTADIANVTDNSVQLVGFCSSTTLAPTLVANVRCRFYG